MQVKRGRLRKSPDRNDVVSVKKREPADCMEVTSFLSK